MTVEEIKAFLIQYYNYDKKSKILSLDNGDTAHVSISNIFCRESNPYSHGISLDNIPDSYKYFKFLGDKEEKQDSKKMNFMETALTEYIDASGNHIFQNDDYILSVELKVASDSTTTLAAFSIKEMLKMAEKNPSVGIYRKLWKGPSVKNDFFAVLIRVKENGQYTKEYLDKYFAASDSRTYRNLNITYNFSDVVDKYITAEKGVKWNNNILIFGAPGTGKSHFIKDRIEAAKLSPEQYCRVTFYSDYTYEKFVGTYKPVPKPDRCDSIEIKTSQTGAAECTHAGTVKGEGITYKFVPGPFLELLAKAIANKIDVKYRSVQPTREANAKAVTAEISVDELSPFILIIEEINRANASAVFGDIFQIIERNETGESEYGITLSSEMKAFMKSRVLELITCDFSNEQKEAIIGKELRELRLPPNFYIWATMNSADQGVFPMDTAFKRRWSYVYQSADKNRTDNFQYLFIPFNEDNKPVFVKWDSLKAAINSVMEKNMMEEDRYIGPWYLKGNEFDDIAEFSLSNNRFELSTPLFDKIMSYLRQDVFKNIASQMFKKEYVSFGKIRSAIYNGIALKSILKLNDDIEVFDPDDVKLKFNFNGGQLGCTVGEVKKACEENNIAQDCKLFFDINHTLTAFGEEAMPENSSEIIAEMTEKMIEYAGNEGFEKLCGALMAACNIDADSGEVKA